LVQRPHPLSKLWLDVTGNDISEDAANLLVQHTAGIPCLMLDVTGHSRTGQVGERPRARNPERS
jgi:hypothetical protein